MIDLDLVPATRHRPTRTPSISSDASEMELVEFLRQTQAKCGRRLPSVWREPDGHYPYPEKIFAEVVMEHMADIGMTFEPNVCHYAARVGNAKLRLSGYAISEDADQLDLFVSLYEGVDEVTPVRTPKPRPPPSNVCAS